MKEIVKNSIVFLLVLISSGLIAQEDTNKISDTLTTRPREVFTINPISTKSGLNESTNLNDSVTINKPYYEKLSPENSMKKNISAMRIVNGKLQLFKVTEMKESLGGYAPNGTYGGGTYSSTKSKFVEDYFVKYNGLSYKISSNNYKTILSKAMSDCPKFVAKLDSIIFEEKIIKDLLIDYNKTCEN